MTRRQHWGRGNAASLTRFAHVFVGVSGSEKWDRAARDPAREQMVQLCSAPERHLQLSGTHPRLHTASLLISCRSGFCLCRATLVEMKWNGIAFRIVLGALYHGNEVDCCSV